MPRYILSPNVSSFPDIVNISKMMNDSALLSGYEEDGSYTAYNEGSGDAIEDFLYTYICPIFILCGILGNSVTFVTLCRPPLNNFSTSVYLAAFSFTAVLTLVFSSGLDWCYTVIVPDKTHFKTSSETACRLWEFFDKMVKCSGVWFTVGAVTDRFIGMWFSHKAQDMCTVFIAKVSVSVSLVAVTSLNVHAMWMHDYHDDGYHAYCYVNPKSEFKVTWFWMSTILCSLIPQSCLFLLGNLLILRLCLKHRGRQIPETASIEMDLTYTVMIFAIIYASFSLPSSITLIVLSLDHSLHQNETFITFNLYMNYLILVSYSCLVVILSLRSAAFRDSVKGACVGCVNLIRHGSTTVEMKMASEDYEQVPSTSTTL